MPVAEEDSSVLHQKALEEIRGVVEAAKVPGHAPQKATVATVDPWLIEATRQQGNDLEGLTHIMDGSAVRHILTSHGGQGKPSAARFL